MNLKSKMVIVLVSIMIILTIAYYGIFHFIILKSLYELDTRHARQNMARCIAAFDREIQHLDKFVLDWANWDDSYNFARDHNRNFIDSNLMSQTFTDQRINLIHVYDAGGRLVWGKTFDLKTEREIPLDLSRELDPVSFQRLIHQQVPGKSTSGVIQTAYGAMIIASNPLLTSEGKGPSQGAMVMGRFFGAESLSLLAEQVDTSLKAWQADRDGLKGHEDLVVSYVSSNTVKLKEVSPEELRAYAVIRDIAGKPAMIMEASLPREIMNEGRWAYTLGMFLILGLGLVILITVSGVIQFMVLKPLSELKKHVLAIGESAEKSTGFVTDRNDEIGTLSREFSHMVDRLAEREKGLELGERRLRQIIDLVPHFIFAKDKDGRFVLVNKAVADFFNTSPKNLIGRKESDFIDAGQGHQENFQEDQEVISSGKSVHNLQQEITDFQGNRRFVQTSKIPFILADVTSPTVLGVSVDITDLKMAEEALRESRTRLSDIIDFLPDATFALDREGKPIAWNRAMEEMSGISKQEIMSRGRYDKSIPFYGEARPAIADLILEDMDGVREKYDYVLKDNDKLISEAFAPCLYNGRGAYIWVVAAPLYDAHGGISGVIESIRDITERKKAEELLKRHSETIEQSLDGIVMADLEGRVTYANKAWSCMHGYSEDEMSGMHLQIFHTQEQFENEVVAFHKKAFEQGSHRGRLNHIRKDGTVFPTLMSAFMLKDEKDRPIALVAIARDISEEMRMENQLQQAQKMEVVGRLAGGIAHDLNNMLSPIIGYSEIMMMGMNEGNPLFDNVCQIKVAADRAKNLTRELLAFSRKQVLEMKVVDLAEVVASYGKMLRRTIREDIAIQIRQNLSRSAVRVDVGQMGQVLMNLAVNAQDAMNQGGVVSIEINDVTIDEAYASTHQGVLPGEYVAMVFSDTGSGMNPRIMENIFEPFFTTKERGKGTGLGLATVYGIIRQHGGHIVVYSEPGMGSTFKIYLPRVEETPEILTTTTVMPRFKEGTETVVVAEDNEGVRELTLDILMKSGYHVLSASDTKELFEILREHNGKVDLLLTDVIMPGMNGRELYENLKSSYPSLKVLYMSGYTDDVIAHHGILEEGVHFIQKPFSISILTDKLRAVLDG